MGRNVQHAWKKQVLTEFLSELIDVVDFDYVIATLGPGIL